MSETTEERRLRRQGADGLYIGHDGETCGCRIGDLRPCGQPKTDCVPARQHDDGLFYPLNSPFYPPPDPVLTRAEAEARLTDEVLDRASRAYAGRYQWRESQMTAERRTPMRDALLSALFPEGGQ